MNNFKNKLKQNNKVKSDIILKGVVSLFFPILGCVLYCLIRGISIHDFYLPDSYNNDTLYYYKLVEAVLRHGSPRGYFGFNESHALVGGFAAWSPVILVPWVCFGFIFGWNYSSILIANIVYFSIAFAFFTVSSNISWKNIIWTMGLFMLFPNLWMHLLVGMPEMIMISVVIVYLGFAFMGADSKEEPVGGIVGMMITGAFLTIIRPYMLVMFVLPVYRLIRRNLKKGIIISVIVIPSVMIIYFLINHFFTAEYLSPMFDLSVVTLFVHGHIRTALSVVYRSFLAMVPQIGVFVKKGFIHGELAGVQYAIAFVTAVIVTLSAFFEKKKKKSVYIQVAASLAVSLTAIIVLLGKANEGGRHIFLFAVTGVLLCAVSEYKRSYIAKAALALIMLVFITRGSLVSTDYDIGVRNNHTEANLIYWENAFEKENVKVSDVLGYDNTFIWTLIDVDNQTGNVVPVNHRELYAVPAGMGISCCQIEYITENFDSLSSRYIASLSGGKVDALCSEAGKKLIGRTDDVVVYQLH